MLKRTRCSLEAISRPIVQQMNGRGCNRVVAEQPPAYPGGATQQRSLVFLILCILALTYGFLSGCRRVEDPDLGWQLATGRWIVQHHQIPSVDVLSFTAQGKPWIYPIGSELIFYAAYVLGGYTLLSLLGAIASVAAVALLVRRGSVWSATLAIMAVPAIAYHTIPRSNMFTTVLFAAFLTLLWQQHETGRARLWLLPLLMVAWVNLHLGLASGLALIAGYVLIECLELVWSKRRVRALEHLRRSWPYLVATFAAPLVNPWGWHIYRDTLSLMSPMAAHSQFVLEWRPATLTWATVVNGVSPRNPDTFIVMLLVAVLAVPIAFAQRQFGAAVLLSGAAFFGIRHMRFQGLFSAMVVVIAGAVLKHAIDRAQQRLEDARIRSILAAGGCCLIIGLVSVWSVDLLTNRTYFWKDDLSSFGTGLAWYFPEGAAAFVESEKIPGEIFNTYDEGGYLSWRLGPHYRDYVDGRDDQRRPDFVEHSLRLMGSFPDSAEWQREAERYNINTIVVPLARSEQFPALPLFCNSQRWRPVYLDEFSAVFVRRTPETEKVIQRLQVDCDKASLPRLVAKRDRNMAFNQWANAAAVLQILGRNQEAFAATSEALAIFPENYYVHLIRGDAMQTMGDVRNAEREYLLAAAMSPNAMSWGRLAEIYDAEENLQAAIEALRHMTGLDPNSYRAFLLLGDDYLKAGRPQEALTAFDNAARSLPKRQRIAETRPLSMVLGFHAEESAYVNLAHGRAMAWKSLGNLNRAIVFEEEAVRLTADRPDHWLELGNLYQRDGRGADAQQARARAAALTSILH